MSRSDSILSPEDLHPSLWRASQLAHSNARCVDTGHPTLSSQLPGGGWPTGTLIDLMPQQCGIGELRLLRPALLKVARRRIVLLQPPHAPQASPGESTVSRRGRFAGSGSRFGTPLGTAGGSVGGTTLSARAAAISSSSSLSRSWSRRVMPFSRAQLV